MTNPPQKDFTHRSWIMATALIAVLIALSFIPPCSVMGVSLRRANILSDIISFDDCNSEQTTNDVMLVEEIAEEELQAIDIEQIAAEIAADVAPVKEEVASDSIAAPSVTIDFVWDLQSAERKAMCDSLRYSREYSAPDYELIAVEDFDTTGSSPWRQFADKIARDESVRVAFLGDSFVEGDIVTSDLRRLLQAEYGFDGDGVGFAPMASPLTGFRRTVKTSASGWTSYNVMQQAKSPEMLRDKFMLGGWVCSPSDGASTRWEVVNKAGDEFSTLPYADIYFLSPAWSRVEVTLNDTLSRKFDVEASTALRRIRVLSDGIHSISFKTIKPARGFVGYGVSLYGDGVTLDNYSVRSNSGQAIFRMNHSLNAQLARMTPYDLVVLQYGLNIMQKGRYNYDSYVRQVEKMVAIIRECFPSAAVLIMGVSDRSVRSDKGGFEPMDALPYMDSAQREAARTTGAAYWSTLSAMQLRGGMAQFVANGWAGKDYTHINFAGGARIAQSLFDAIRYDVYQSRLSLPESIRKGEATPILTPQMREKVDMQLSASYRHERTQK